MCNATFKSIVVGNKNDQSHCLNNGTCLEVTALHTVYCVCRQGFTGQRCELQDIQQFYNIPSIHIRSVLNQVMHIDFLRIKRHTSLRSRNLYKAQQISSRGFTKTRNGKLDTENGHSKVALSLLLKGMIKKYMTQIHISE